MQRALCLAVLVLTAGCQAPSEKMAHGERPINPHAFKARLQEIAEHYVQKFPAVPGVIISCDSPLLGGVAQAAAGHRNPGTGSLLVPTDQFCPASIGKMFVAATILRSWEEGLLQLDAPIAQYLPGELMDGLARFEGVDYGKTITVRQCLLHTSGLADCYSDGVRNSDGLSPFDLELKRNPNKFWTSPEVIVWTKANLQPVGPPGLRFHYSDTGYQLLGLVIEAVRKKALAVAVREVVLDPLRMNDTYAHHREEVRRSPGVGLFHFFDGASDNTEALSESADWGGGGWVTNAPDLTRFLRALSENRLFRNPGTWRLMQAWSPQSKGTYGLALERYVTPVNDELMGHGGYFGSFAAVWPKADRSVFAARREGTIIARNTTKNIKPAVVASTPT